PATDRAGGKKASSAGAEGGADGARRCAGHRSRSAPGDAAQQARADRRAPQRRRLLDPRPLAEPIRSAHHTLSFAPGNRPFSAPGEQKMEEVKYLKLNTILLIHRVVLQNRISPTSSNPPRAG